MWSRRELKERAKSVLRINYWKAFLISLVIAFASGGFGGGGGSGRDSNNSGINGNFRGFDGYSTDSFPFDIAGPQLLMFIAVFLFVFIGLLIFFAAIRIFLGYPLEVGGRKYFIQSAQYFDNRRCIRYAFYSSNYTGIILTMLLKGVQNFLWFLLFIIPGIVKYYSYRMVPYILADNPNIGAKRAIRLSMDMTSGQKFNMFVLDISFIGWYILGLIALFIGTLFVLPYSYATEAELYLELRRNALFNSMCTAEELQLDNNSFN